MSTHFLRKRWRPADGNAEIWWKRTKQSFCLPCREQWLCRSPLRKQISRVLPLPMLTPAPTRRLFQRGDAICRHYLILQTSQQTCEACSRRYPQLTSPVGQSLPKHQTGLVACQHCERPRHQHRLSKRASLVCSATALQTKCKTECPLSQFTRERNPF